MGRLSNTQAALVMVGVFLVGAGHAEESRQKFSDPSEKSLEAGAVSLIQNASGRVVEVRVSDCELCDRASYLPDENLEVEVSGDGIRPEAFSEYSGRAGTIVYDQNNSMVFGVYYWGSRLAEDDR